MNKKSKKPKGHIHSWKAVRFLPFSETQGGFLGSGPVEVSGTRVGFECEGCPERRFQDTSLSEVDARWVARADESVPDAFVQAFEENAR